MLATLKPQYGKDTADCDVLLNGPLRNVISA